MEKYFIAYEIQGAFFLWKGPIANDSNLHYAKFYGVGLGDVGEIWVLERTDPPENATEIDDMLALKLFMLIKPMSGAEDEK